MDKNYILVNKKNINVVKVGNKKKINKPKKNKKNLFRKKKIRLPSINKLDKLLNNIEKILKYEEKIIIKYLERIIFTSILSVTTQKQIEDIFKESRIDL